MNTLQQETENESLKKIRFALNVITPDNFDTLKYEIHELARKDLTSCLAVGNQIVSNAWDQKPYSRTYARLCKFLGDQDTLRFDQKKDASKSGPNDFTKHVLGLVENVMGLGQKLIPGAEENMSSYPANYERYSKDPYHKRERMFGNIIFLGDLYLEGVISVQVIRSFTGLALRKFLLGFREYKSGPQKDKNQLYEDPLGCLTLLYARIGRKLDECEKNKTENIKSKSTGFVQQFQTALSSITKDTQSEIQSFDEVSLNDFFQILDLVLKEAGFSQRLNCLALNLRDRRAKSWEEPPGKNEEPKTMKELHDEFEREIEANRKIFEKESAGRQTDQRQLGDDGTQTQFA